MSVEMCSRCDRFVDLDWHCDDMEYIGAPDDPRAPVLPVCSACVTPREWNVIEPGSYTDEEVAEWEAENG